jgi:hypothetical protein
MKRALIILLLALSAGIAAQEPAPEPRPQEEKQPPRRPAAPPAPPAARVPGVADDFPAGEERYLPDFKITEEQAAPLEAKGETKPPETPSADSGFRFSSLFEGDRTFLNILLLCAIVGVFVLYRLRGRR